MKNKKLSYIKGDKYSEGYYYGYQAGYNDAKEVKEE
jgi:hypothetical protein